MALRAQGSRTTKFYPSCQEWPALATQLLPFIESVKIIQTTVPEIRDPDNAKFTTCAATAGVRRLVGGDDNLLSLHHIQSVAVISVSAFLQLLKAKP
ncbi:hypothetical protein YTPLAS72_31220 [Nitrospira sp.]|nr:hypothetical protein YTPLAS72_31220 [Nitrospira sp.]